MAKKDKKINSVINALKHLEGFSNNKLEEIKVGLKDINQRNSLLKELQLPIKKGQLIQKLKLCNIVFEEKNILNEENYSELKKIEKLLSLEIHKNNLLKTINDKKLPVSKEIIQSIVKSNSISELNQILQNIPNSIRIHISYNRKSGDSDSSSISPIYTPMGNKR